MRLPWLPLGALDDLASSSSLNFARPTYRAITNVGATTSQGDTAQRTDDVRNAFALNGTGVTVGVISDSYDTAYQLNPPGFIRASNDVASGDLPSGVNVLDDSDPLVNTPRDEGRAMLQIIHDVAPGASLAFHTAGIDQMAMRDSILDLKAVGADVIVDDILFPTEPMFQDGIVAQAVDEVVSEGVTYFSAAGNYARRSYEATFTPGASPLFFAGESAHQFSPGDIRQSVTVPNGAVLRLSLQWDSPFDSAGTARADDDLNIYLVRRGTSQVVTFQNNDNLNRDAVEVLDWPNNFSQTQTTEFDIIITLRAGIGSLPLVKYVDLSADNTTGQAVTFNEYTTNSATLFGHANSEGAIAVGAAAYFQTPEFGVSPPVVQNFSAVAGVPIIFSAAGVRLGTPISRQKTDVVGPDNANTTFFGTDVAQDADVFPNFRGTSAAAPHVAGIAALMLQGNPSATPALIEQALEQTTTDMDNPYVAGFQTGHDVATGWGLVNAFTATYNVFKPSAPDLKNTSDWGFSETDNITFDTLPTLTGTAPAGSYVWIYRNSTSIVDAFQLAPGVSTYERTLTAPLATGFHSISVRVAENSFVPVAERSQPSNALPISILNGHDTNPVAQTFSARFSETLVVTGVQSDGSTLRIDWGDSPEEPPRSLTKSGAGTVAIPDPNPNQLIKISDRTVTLTYVHSGGTTNFDVNTGTANNVAATNWTVEVNAPGVVFNSQVQNLAKLDIKAGGVATIAYTEPPDPPTEQEIPYKVLHLRSLAIAGTDINPTGKLDITNNALIIDYGTGANPETQIRKWIIAGRGTTDFIGLWTGNGITSSTAASNSSERAVGYADNGTMPLGPLSVFVGYTVDNTDVLVRYTVWGDTNLDGAVNDDDVTVVGATYAPGVPNASWANGDLEYNGFVDDDDITVVGALYNPSFDIDLHATQGNP